MELPRFLVIQNGARHDYAVPSALCRAGTLAALFTDFTSTNGFGQALSRIPDRFNPFVAQLARRTPPPSVATVTHTSTPSFLLAHFLARTKCGDAGLYLSRKLFERTLLHHGNQGATHIYTMNGEGGSFLQTARQQGLGVIVDIFIAPSADAVEANEMLQFPDWADIPSAGSPRACSARSGMLHLEDTDLLLCPSEFVQDDVISTYGVSSDRVFVVPYAVNPRWLSLKSSPEPGRVLFAGTASLRKGIHYLAEAAQLLRDVVDVRVAGSVSERVRDHPGARDLTFLGHLSKACMAEEFARADVLAFPSLAEGAASVTAEAMGAGVPVVTTRSSGSIIRHGIDGLIVPERDSEALAEAVLSIVNDRGLRDEMSLAARARALEFTWDRFASEVIRVAMNYNSSSLEV